MADTLGLGPSGVTRAGSSPVSRTRSEIQSDYITSVDERIASDECLCGNVKLLYEKTLF